MIIILTTGAAGAGQAEPLCLQSLVPTSGGKADVLLDGDLETGWSPSGDPGGEGVLLRFEQPEPIDRVQVLLCSGSGAFELVPYVNGTSLSAQRKGREGEEYEIALSGQNKKIRSLFLRISSAKGVPCLAEVRFHRGREVLPVKPPRTVSGRVEASSTLKPIDAYHVAYLFDGRTDFGWVEGAKGLGKGESVTLELDEPVEVVALELWNGYQRSRDHFRKNARATRLGLRIDGGDAIPLKVADRMGPQKLKLPKAVKGKTFQLTIEAARRGKRYPDLVMSELRLWDARGPLTVETPDMAERQQALMEQVAGTPLSDVVDRQWVCRCGDMRLTRLKLRTNHTFVWYQDVESEDEVETRSQSEVFDGAWVVGKPKPPSAAIKLFGRRHRTSSVFNPYAGNRVRDSVRIGGGNVSVTRLADIDAQEFAELVRRWARGPAADRVDCLDLSARGMESTYEALKGRDAIVLQGKAMTDLMVHDSR